MPALLITKGTTAQSLANLLNGMVVFNPNLINELEVRPEDESMPVEVTAAQAQTRKPRQWDHGTGAWKTFIRMYPILLDHRRVPPDADDEEEVAGERGEALAVWMCGSLLGTS